MIPPLPQASRLWVHFLYPRCRKRPACGIYGSGSYRNSLAVTLPQAGRGSGVNLFYWGYIPQTIFIKNKKQSIK